MTRLEKLFEQLDRAYDENADSLLDAEAYVKNYLAERDQAGTGIQFDSEQVDDAPDDEPTGKYEAAFDEMLGRPLEKLDKLTIRGNRTAKEGV